MQWYEQILIGLSVGQFLAMIVGGYLFLSKPARKNSARIEKIEVSCPITHKRLNEIIGELKEHLKNTDETLLLMERNTLKHIEERMTDLSKQYVEIKTILDERLPRK